jgi:tRNA A-37 threonylcarbamoyl transferase component Bud32
MAFAKTTFMPQGGDAFAPVLAALKADPATEFGQPGAKVELLGRIDGPFSTVQRVRIETPARSLTAYAKILKPYHDTPEELERADRMLRREYLATSALYQALHQDAEIGAVRPIAFLPELRAIVTEEVPGRPMSELLAETSHASPEALAVARRVGAWIRIYQSLVESTGTVELQERRAYLDERLKQMEGRVIPPAERQDVLALFDALAAQLPPEFAAVPIHADLTPMNIIVDASGRIAVLDFTMAKMGASYHDISHVFFHLEMLGARQRKSVMARELQRALLAGYSPALAEDSPLFQLMLLQHVVCHAALLGARRVPVVDLLYRWFVRRRWKACRRMIQRPASKQQAA